jgi:hypothetical protein
MLFSGFEDQEGVWANNVLGTVPACKDPLTFQDHDKKR